MSSREKTPVQWEEINAKYDAASKKAVEDLASKIANQIRCPTSRKQECRKDAAYMIDSMLDHEGVFNSTNLPHTIETKKSLRRFAKAVEDFEHVLKNTPSFPHPLHRLPTASIEELLAFGLHCKKVANAKGKPANNKEAEKRRHAVRYAHDMMAKYDPNNIVGTKGKDFCKLAEALYVGLAEINDVERDDRISTVPDLEKLDLSSVCAAHLRNLKSRHPK
jgi:hypothetical protein